MKRKASAAAAQLVQVLIFLSFLFFRWLFVLRGFRGRLSVLATNSVSRSAVWLQCIQFFFSKTLFDFKKSISGLIELKFSGKTPNEVLYAPICFWGVYF